MILLDELVKHSSQVKHKMLL